MSNEPKKYHIRAGLYVLRDTNATAILKIEEDNDGRWMFCEDYEKLKKQLEWQLIETAPKDGTRILVFCSHSNMTVETCWIKNENTLCGWWWNTKELNPPTHWMPLPKPPKQ